MEIIRSTTDFQLNKDTAVAIGKFDGIHVGHRALLQEILEQKQNGLSACVFTFDPTPAVLFGQSDGRELSTREEKRLCFEQMGVDILIEYPLTFETAAIEPELFVREYLMKRMRARFVAAGEDVSFGRYGAGNAALLRQMGEYTLRIIEKICVDCAEVSSTRIRGLVEQGHMEEAERLLGAPYTVCGTVVQGNRIGRTIGFPTVNLLPPAQKLLPPNGVYRSRVRLANGRVYKAISNVGCKPTVTDAQVMGLESYLYGFDEELYGADIAVELLDFQRPERKFAGLDALREQLQRDIANERPYGQI
ncbi:MAG: riboflavin biosynthesis protein RibF [Lachnospiraceae bacterium]|nr:riboflavin biosynthesis protein RibF [Lachnospiraceae bacterium]